MHVLVVSYAFPPYSGPGPARLARFVRHFVESGGKVTVIAPKIDEYARAEKSRPLDWSMLQTLPQAVGIRRVGGSYSFGYRKLCKRLHVGRLFEASFAPDPHIVWRQGVVAAAVKINGETPVDCIYTSGPPFSAHLVGLAVADRLGLPWVAEFRDPWTGQMNRCFPSVLHWQFERMQERRVLAAARRVVMNTPEARQRMLRQYAWLPREKVVSIPNSFDVDEFDNGSQLEVVAREKMQFAYVGGFAGGGPPLNASEVVAWRAKLRELFKNGLTFTPNPWDPWIYTPWYLFQALAEIRQRLPREAAQLELVLAGGYSAATMCRMKQHVASLGIESMVRWTGHLNRLEAVQLMKSADALVLLCTAPADGDAPTVVPAKTYEYIAAQRPILAAMPHGDAYSLVEESGLAVFADPRDPKEIADRMIELFQMRCCGDARYRINPDVLDRFRSDRLARQVWDVLERACSKE